TAAHVAGVLSLPDAARLVTARGRLMQAAQAGGAMIAVEATEDEVLPLLDERLSLAAVNGPTAVVVSGDTDAAETVAEHFRDLGRRTRRLTVSHAFHSPHMDTVLDDFTREIRTLDFQPPQIPVLSNVTGVVATTGELTSPEYWARHIRGTVRFHHGIQHLATEHAVTAYLELGPDPVLTANITTTVNGNALAVAALRKGRPEDETFLTALAHLWTTGTPITWEKTPALTGGRAFELPTYAFQHQRYWLEAPATTGDATGLGLAVAGHGLLGAAVDLADEGGAVLTGRLSHATQPWLAGHTILGRVLLPGTAFVDLAVAAGDRVGAGHLEDLTLHAPLVITEAQALQLQATLTPDDGGYALAVHSRPDNGNGPWVRHATGRLTAQTAEVADDASAWPPNDAQPVDLDGLYERLAVRGYEYGPLFQGLRAAWRHQDGGVSAEITLPADDTATDTDAFGIHPALLDAALHALLLDDRPGEPVVVLPFAWSGVTLHATGATTLHVHWTTTGENTHALTATDPTGTPVITADALTLLPTTTVQTTTHSNDLYQLTWTPTPDTAEAEAETAGGRELVVLGTETFGLTGVPVHTTLDDVPAGAHVLLTVQPSPLDAGPAHTHTVLTDTLAVLQAWLAHPGHTDGHLTVVTRHAVTTRPADPAPDLTAAAVWGL
ncbi:acyltransferase domain-containing protein, partial [Streptomyces sp. NPDC004031]